MLQVSCRAVVLLVSSLVEALASCVDAKPIIISNPTVSKAKAAAEQFFVPEWTESDMEVL